MHILISCILQSTLDLRFIHEVKWWFRTFTDVPVIHLFCAQTDFKSLRFSVSDSGCYLFYLAFSGVWCLKKVRMRVCILMLTPDLCRPHYLTEQPTSFLAAQWKWIPLSAPSLLSSAPHNHFRLASLYSGHAASNDGWSHNPCLKRNLSVMHYKAFFILLYMLSNKLETLRMNVSKFKCLFCVMMFWNKLENRTLKIRKSYSENSAYIIWKWSEHFTVLYCF